ncbi:hypothetical protein SAMN04488134_103179 [Amphibacillus marinus]|uniref:DUF1680 family protein n=1 Tax=Amphibacillus marinus TaxID=872970 RepID=A0A1H8LEI0_9BACI|nr:beta-L-arabinofuranosidase domain-containing protein [Amphibacillus marinus]SEO03545.1 hypothetical protein SAMN04488134_103179 [Amphibacillus marinus]
MLKEFPLKQIHVTDVFWQYYLKLIKDTVIPYQYEVLNDAIDVDVQAERKDNNLPTGKSHALANFRITAGIEEGEHFGWFFQDSDVYKWLEAVGYSLEVYPDPKLEETADQVIELIGKAQEQDGYLDTFFQLKFPKLKYRQLYFSHELYCAGHLIEAAIAYHQATGKDSLLQIALKFVDHIDAHFGYEEGKIQGADGHQEIELALVRLYEHTGDEKYLALANFFIDVRGKDPEFYDKEIQANLESGLATDKPSVNLEYLQAYTQPKDQTLAKGHAVRMLYMATGMAKIAHYTKDKELLSACEAIWHNVTRKKMYVTAGVGSTVAGEAFTGDYDLPNDTMYCETCASIALVYFAYELFKIEPKAEYIDVIERALYNGILSGASIDGKHFFYVNPLEVDPDSCEYNPNKGHVKLTRPDWLGCACCPPNFARTIGSVERYIYTKNEADLYVNLFVSSALTIDDTVIKQTTAFPYENHVKLSISNGAGRTIFIRKPRWAEGIQLTTEANWTENDDYFVITVASDALTLEVSFEQPILYLRSNPKVRAANHQVAIQRGPFIYCAEQVDNEADLHLYHLDKNKPGMLIETSALLDKTLQLTLAAKKEQLWDADLLYSYQDNMRFQDTKLTLIPYHLWGNRGENEMKVWFK